MKKNSILRENIYIVKRKLALNLKHKIGKHQSLYCLIRSIKCIHSKVFYKLIFGYYEDSTEFTSFIIEHKGDMYPECIIYHILTTNRGFLDTEEMQQCVIGLFGLFRHVLQGLIIAENLGAIPVVEIGTNSLYHDPDLDDLTKNVFEYYFEPVSFVKYTDVNLCSKVIRYCETAPPFFMPFVAHNSGTYKISSNNIEQMGQIYKKYIKLNSQTDKIINESILTTLGNKKTLGVHIRGTDFNIKYGGHPNIIDIDEYISNTFEIFSSGNYEQIFLATDDSNALRAFQNKFGDSLVMYNDVFRSSSSIGVHWKNVDSTERRQLHNYKLGLEVIRDVYTLTACDGLICGLSQVAYAARYIKLSKDESYDVLRVIDHGVRKE